MVALSWASAAVKVELTFAIVELRTKFKIIIEVLFDDKKCWINECTRKRRIECGFICLENYQWRVEWDDVTLQVTRIAVYDGQIERWEKQQNKIQFNNVLKKQKAKQEMTLKNLQFVRVGQCTMNNWEANGSKYARKCFQRGRWWQELEAKWHYSAWGGRGKSRRFGGRWTCSGYSRCLQDKGLHTGHHQTGTEWVWRGPLQSVANRNDSHSRNNQCKWLFL